MMKKKDYIIVFILLVICGIGYLFYSMMNEEKDYAIVYHNNKEVDRIDLSINDIYTYEGDYGSFSIEVKDFQYHAVHVECPNHDCEKVGWVKKDSPISIICVPNMITVQQENINIDGID